MGFPLLQKPAEMCVGRQIKVPGSYWKGRMSNEETNSLYLCTVRDYQSEGGAGLERDSTTTPTPDVPRSQTETVIKGDILTLPVAACEAHNGLARAQNSNLSPLTSETMWYQPPFTTTHSLFLLP